MIGDPQYDSAPVYGCCERAGTDRPCQKLLLPRSHGSRKGSRISTSALLYRTNLQYSTSECEYIGLFLLLKLFQSLYCEGSAGDDPLDTDLQPKPNDFSDFTGYFLKKVC